jgi:hypothetical protein
MLPKFENEVDMFHFHQKLDSDFTFGAIATRPLYYDNNNTFVGTNGNDILGQIDLKSILKKLMKDANMGCINPTVAGPLQKRAWMSILYNAVGRAGEVKFIDTANWMWHLGIKSLIFYGQKRRRQQFRQWPQSLKNTLELCQFVCTDEEEKDIRNGQILDEATLTTITTAVQKEAFLKMWTFEGVADPEATFKTNANAGSRAKKPTYNAVGKRVKKYKQALAGHGGIPGDHNNEPLRDRPEGLVYNP